MGGANGAVMKTMMRLLDIRNRMTCAESNPLLDRMVEEQYEHTSEFAAREGKRILILALAETDHTHAMLRDRAQFQEIHLLLGRIIVEDHSHGRLIEALRWLRAVTDDGLLPLTTIEIIGTIRTCGCRFGELTKYTRHLVIGERLSLCPGRLNFVN